MFNQMLEIAENADLKNQSDSYIVQMKKYLQSYQESILILNRLNTQMLSNSDLELVDDIMTKIEYNALRARTFFALAQNLVSQIGKDFK